GAVSTSADDDDASACSPGQPPSPSRSAYARPRSLGTSASAWLSSGMAQAPSQRVRQEEHPGHKGARPQDQETDPHPDVQLPPTPKSREQHHAEQDRRRQGERQMDAQRPFGVMAGKVFVEQAGAEPLHD